MDLAVSSVIQHPVAQAATAGMLSWLSVSLGAAFIFTRREFSRKAMDCLLGAAGGMMLGASFFGLLQPAMDLTSHMGRTGFIPVVFGMMLGAVFLLLLDRVLPCARHHRRHFNPLAAQRFACHSHGPAPYP